MPLKPKAKETQREFVQRCMSEEAEAIPDQKQRAAACFSMWRKAKGGKKPKSNATEHVPSVFRIAQEIETRTELLDGKEHIVLPLVALVEGVYQCANCPAPNYYPAREFGKNVGAWNGRPVTVDHPQRNGNFVSAGSPDVWQTERIGTVFGAMLDNGKLRVEAWIDQDQVERAGDDAKALLQAIEDGDEVEVSTAAWVDEAPRVGSHAGRKYEGVQTNFQPDHIALLPLGQRGACNWEDGCGVRVASAGDPCCDGCAKGEPCDCEHEHDDEPEVNQTVRSREQALEIALEDKHQFAFVLDHDDQYVYYHADDQRGIQRCSYTEDDDGNITLGEEPERVRPRQEFVAINHEEDGDMAGDKTKAAAQGAPSDDQTNDDNQDQQQPKAQQQAQPTNIERRLMELEEENRRLKAAAEKPKAQTIEDYVAQAPAQMREFLSEGLRMQTRKRFDLVEQIRAVDGCMYEEDELKAMEIPQLEKLLSLTRRTADFSVQPPERSRLVAPASIFEDVAGADYAPLPPSIYDKPKS